jgi:hypothetical protein
VLCHRLFEIVLHERLSSLFAMKSEVAVGHAVVFIVDGPLALGSQRLAAASEGAIGRDILTFPLLAARLAGGFLSPVGTDVLFPAIQRALADGGFQDIASVARLPGMSRAVLQSLDAIWRADIDLSSLPNDVSRLADLHLIETRIRQRLLHLIETRIRQRLPRARYEIKVAARCDWGP